MMTKGERFGIGSGNYFYFTERGPRVSLIISQIRIQKQPSQAMPASTCKISLFPHNSLQVGDVPFPSTCCLEVRWGGGAGRNRKVGRVSSRPGQRGTFQVVLDPRLTCTAANEVGLPHLLFLLLRTGAALLFHCFQGLPRMRENKSQTLPLLL